MAAANGPFWFQLYVFRDRAITASLVQRAEAAGCKAVVLTVDMPMQGKVTGTAYITGTSEFFFDPDDPLREGFLL